MEAILLEFLKLVIPSLAQGLLAAVTGKSLDEAMLRTITHMQDVRAKAKFPNLKPDSDE